jgi:hypothetical protein
MRLNDLMNGENPVLQRGIPSTEFFSPAGFPHSFQQGVA